MIRLVRRRLAAAWTVALVSGACGEEPRLETSAARAMHRDVDEVRAAAAAGDRDGALRALDGLARRVQRQRDGGRLSETDVAGLLDRVEAAKRRVRQEMAEPQPTAEPTATPDQTTEPAPGEPGTGNDEQKGKGETEGKGKGREKDEDEDKGGDD